MKSNGRLIKRVYGALALLLSLLFIAPSAVLAANYGDGNYGSGNYGVGDATAPTGGSITYTDGYYTSASVALTINDGTDIESGINTASRIVQRDTATQTGGTCGTYGSFAVITPTGTYPNLTDSTVVSGNCYQYRYLVSDNSSNQATYTSSNVVKVDTSLPSTPGIPSTTTPTNSLSQTWNWPASTDAVSGIANYLWRTTGTAVVSGSTATNSVVTSLSEGTYTFYVKAVDNAGNQGAESLAGTLTVDLTAPTIPGTPTTSTPTTDTTPSWTWTASTDTGGSGLATNAYSLQWCQDSGFSGCGSNIATSTTNSYTHGTALADGTWYIKVKAVDAANNQSAYSSNGQVVIDTIAPTINITNLGLISNVPNQTNLMYYFTSQTPYIQGETEANSTVHFKYNGHDYTATAGTDGKYAISISNPDLPRTSVTLTYYAVDPAGNKSAERTLTLIIGIENFPSSNTEAPEVTSIPTATDLLTVTPTPIVPTIVTFKIEDENGKLLVNATVTIDRQKYISDSKGQIYLEGTPSPNSQITLEYNGKKLSGKIVGDKIIAKETTTSGQNNTWTIIVITTVIAGLGGGGYLYWKKRKE